MKHLLFLTQYKAQPDRRSSDGGMWKTQKARFKDLSEAMQNEKDIKETITYIFCSLKPNAWAFQCLSVVALWRF